MHYDVVIVGAGASGLMCAAQVGYAGLRVLVIDHAPKAAQKIRISGGGKCNFTNLDVKPSHYVCANPHFVKSALARYPSSAFIEWVERHGIAYEQRRHGQLFTLNGAGEMIAALRLECDWAGVDFQLATTIHRVEALESGYRLRTSAGEYQAPHLVVATGGLAYPKLKASDWGMKLARQFGLKVKPSRPGLVPLQFKSPWREWFAALSGFSLVVEMRCQQACFRETLLITHQGISGPVVLQISNYWQPGWPIVINLLPDCDVLAELVALKAQAGRLHKWLYQAWSKRFAQAWLSKFPLQDDLANVSDNELMAYARQLSEWTLYPEDSAGYDKAEVSLGGVDTDEVSSKTLEAHRQPGLYFIGEVLDVTGHLGGYNFQWAWASAHAAAQALSQTPNKG
jgi:hypothetical protein